MKVVIRFSKAQEIKALPILLRHSPGMILKDRTYVIDSEAARALRDAGIQFTEVTSDVPTPGLEGVGEGERI